MKYLLAIVGTLVFMGSAMASEPVSPYEACDAINEKNSYYGNLCVDVVVNADSFSRHAAGACKAIMDNGGNSANGYSCMKYAANTYIEPHGAAVCGAIKNNSYYASVCMEAIANKTMDRKAAQFCQRKAENGDNSASVYQCVKNIAKDYDPDVVGGDCLSDQQILNRVQRASDALDIERPQRAKRVLRRLMNRLEMCL